MQERAKAEEAIKQFVSSTYTCAELMSMLNVMVRFNKNNQGFFVFFLLTLHVLNKRASGKELCVQFNTKC